MPNPPIDPTTMPHAEGLPRSLRVLAGMSYLFHSCIEEPELLGIIEHYLPALLPGTRSGLYLRRPGEAVHELALPRAEGFPGPTVVHDMGCPALARRLPVEKAREAGECRCMGQDGTRNYCVPLVACGEALGLLSFHVEPQDGECVFSAGRDASGRGFALLAAESIAMALHNIRLRKLLTEQAVRDPLTGLYNRRYLEERLEQALGERDSERRRLGIVLLDLDRFKTVNDGFGHDAGDVVLRQVGRLLLSSVRESDIACRFGGEEFVLVLLGAGYGACRVRAEGLLRDLRELRIMHHGRVLPSISFSAGCAVAPVNGEDRATLLAAADKALYRAKAAGRGRIVMAEAGELS